MDYIFGLLWALLGLGVLVFIHEMGHFLIARRTGIGVEAFSIGFGGPIYHFYKNGVDWRIGWIPFGGYCKMKGQDDFKETTTKGEPDEFYVRPPWARLLTILGGPVFNIVLGIILLTIITYFVGEKIILNDKIVINPKYKDELNLKNNDIIKEIDGKKITLWNDIKKFLLMEGIDKESYIFTIKRKDKIINIEYNFDKNHMIKGNVGFSLAHKVKIKKVNNNSPAQKAGLKINDIITHIDGQEINSTANIHYILNKSKEKTITHKFAIDRKGKNIELDITPKLSKLPNSNEKRKLIGIILGPHLLNTKTKNYSILESIPKGIEKGWNIITLFPKQFKLLSQVDGDTLKESISGPVGIIVHIGKAGNRGFADFIVFIAIISILLGIFNLLPIPAVDGGHIILTTVEMIRRKPFSLKFIQRFQMVGLFIILTIFVLATANDISKFIFK